MNFSYGSKPPLLTQQPEGIALYVRVREVFTYLERPSCQQGIGIGIGIFNDNEETNQNKTTTKYETRRRNDLKSLVVAMGTCSITEKACPHTHTHQQRLFKSFLRLVSSFVVVLF